MLIPISQNKPSAWDRIFSNSIDTETHKLTHKSFIVYGYNEETDTYIVYWGQHITLENDMYNTYFIDKRWFLERLVFNLLFNK